MLLFIVSYVYSNQWCCLRLNVSEDIGQLNLTVVRNQGVFGEVSVLYGIININTNALGLPADYAAMTSAVKPL